MGMKGSEYGCCGWGGGSCYLCCGVVLSKNCVLAHRVIGVWCSFDVVCRP